MDTVKGNIWNIKTDAICIPTNGYLKKNGECVMGAGLAKQAKERYPELPVVLGKTIKNKGHKVHNLGIFAGKAIFSFPVKPVGDAKRPGFLYKADLSIIEISCLQLVECIKNSTIIKKVLLPAVGCGNGKLKWRDVEPILDRYLDERFMVVFYDSN